MIEKIISFLLIVAGIILLLPVIGVIGAERLAIMYGISFQEPNLLILMRHRAVLFGLLGTFIIYAAFRPSIQPLALLAGFIGAGSFIVLAKAVGAYNATISKVVLADIVAVVCLVVAFGLRRMIMRRDGDQGLRR